MVDRVARPISRRHALALLATAAAVWPYDVGSAQAADDDHQPRLELPFLAENPASVPVRVWVEHPMEADHFIRSIEIDLDRDPVPHKATFRFTPSNGQAWVAFPMRSGTGGLVRATIECTRHGRFVGTREMRVTSDGCVTLSGPIARDTQGNPRLRLSRPGKLGEIVEVRTKIDHDSDTGLTQKGAQHVRERPEYFVKRAQVFLGRELISDFRFTSALSPNPIVRFSLRISRADTLRVVFLNNEGRQWEVAESIRPGV